MPPRDNNSIESSVHYQQYKYHSSSNDSSSSSRKVAATMDYPDEKKTPRKSKSKPNKTSSQKKAQARTDDYASDSSSYKKGRKSRSSKRKSKSREKNATKHELIPHPNFSHGPEPITVSSFLSKQKLLQREAETYRSDNKMLLTDGEDYGMMDVVPSDHPSSSIIQTHRTCTICHRTLRRSQFSERDRGLVHLSLGPGAVCRTCSMTVAATKLKMMPSHGELLNDYANHGEYLISTGQLPALGYALANKASAERALVLHSGVDVSAGNELVPFQPGMDGNSVQRVNPFMRPLASVTMGTDVNNTFSGILPEEERPTYIADCKYIDAVLSMPCYSKLNSMELFSSSKDVSVSMAALDAVKLYGTMNAEYFVPLDGDGEKFTPRSIRKKVSGDSSANFNPKSIVCLVIGEGSLPRTAVLASLHYGWTTLSIDPNLADDWDGYQDDVPNYTGYSGTISEFMSDEYTASHFELDNSPSGVNHLVIIGVQTGKDQMRLNGQSNINEIRARYNEIPTTLVSMSPLKEATLAPKRRDGQCSSKLEKDVGYEPNCSYIDEGVFSACRLVEVWNFHNSDEDDVSGEDDDSFYSKESIERDRRNTEKEDHEKISSMEQLSLQDNNDSTYKRLQEHISSAERDRKEYDKQKYQLARKGTNDSLMSGSTLSTRETKLKYSAKKKRNSRRRTNKKFENTDTLTLPIASVLERENSRRKSKSENKTKNTRKISGPRPIPDDIPENLEIYSDHFAGQGSPLLEYQVDEWSEEQVQANVYSQCMVNEDTTTNMDSHIGAKKGNYYNVENPMENKHHLSDMWKGVITNVNGQGACSDDTAERYRENKNEDDFHDVSQLKIDEQESHYSDRSNGTYYHRDTVRIEKQAHNNTAEGQNDYDSSDTKKSDQHDRKGTRYSNFQKESDQVKIDSDHTEKDLDHPDHSSDELDAIRNKTYYYGNDEKSSHYDYDSVEDQTSTNSGIAALNDCNISRSKLGQRGTNEEEDHYGYDDCDYWSEDNEVAPSLGAPSSKSKKTQPWHRKKDHENSFISYESYD